MFVYSISQLAIAHFPSHLGTGYIYILMVVVVVVVVVRNQTPSTRIVMTLRGRRDRRSSRGFYVFLQNFGGARDQ